MELKEAVRHIGGKLLYETEEILQRQYSYAVASDLMSNVMLDTADDSMLITSLVNPQVIRASEMMNITCIIITCGKQVTDAMIELARNRNIALVETKGTTFTVCGKLHKLGITEGPLQLEDSHVTSIDIRTNRCIGCIHCVRNCPTEAIRVKAGKAVIRAERCIECGMCVKVCPRHAMNPVVDTLESLKEYDYRIAIPASSFFGQFAGVRSRDHLLTALKMVGFDEIY
jgi:ferredoxin